MQTPDDARIERMSYDAGFELMSTAERMGEMRPGEDTTADMIGQMDDKLSPSDAMLPTDSNDNTFSNPPYINLMHSIDAKVDSEMREDSSESALERNSKSSRRKQSKPLRVHHIDLPNIESEPMEVPQPEQGTETTDGMIPKEDQQNGTRNSTCNTPEFMDTEHTISCDFCPGTFNSLHALKDHLINAHAHPMNADGSSMYPTEYHRLASELYPANGESEKTANFENSTAPAENEKPENPDDRREERRSPLDGSIPRDMPDSNNPGDGEVIKSHGTRIFHPDAYCELCDREFCNKYFLKTHKANKHGIYDNTFSQPPPPPLGQVPPMPSHMFPMFLPQPPPQLPQPPQPPQSQPENLVAMSHATSATTSLPNPIVTSLPSPVPPKPLMMPSLQPPEPSKKSPPVSEPTKPKSESSGTNAATVGDRTDMEDYCEICQKHFCNKYYLRKHKLDVHGIHTEPPANKRSRANHSHNPSDLSFGGMGGLTPPMFLPQNIPNSMTNIMLINPFGPLMALPQSPSLFHAQLPQLPQTSTPLKSSQALPPLPGMDDREKEREHREREREREREMRERDQEQMERERESRERDHDRDRERDHDRDRERDHDRDREHDREMERERERERDREHERERDSEHERRDSANGSPSLSTGQLSQETLRSMGVLNADAYCEICRKEFCNKYFLKIHKANKHGMFIDDSPMKRSPTGSMSNHSTSSPFDALGPLSDKEGERPIKRESSGTPTNPSSRIGTPGTPAEMNMPINFSTYGEPRNEDRSRQQMEQQIRQHVDQQIRQQQAEQAMRYQADHHMRQQVDHQRREQADREREMRQQVDQHMRNQEQMRQHDREREREREMRHQAEQQMSRPFDPQARPPIDPETVCEICNKEFINKYTLQIHRLNAHGISSRDSETASTPTSDIDSKPVSMPPQPMPADHPSPLPPASSSGSDVPTMPTMFSSMIAAKLADRVMCDICNKEVCNKYFLKTHKLKMHGIPPPPGSTTPKSQDREQKNKTPSITDGKISPISAGRSSSSIIKTESFSMSNGSLSKAEVLKNSDKPLRHDELLKMGIDPEAYCELCKKEFCSKYFLRTHKLNMHGIRSDKPEPPPIKKEDFLFKDYTKERERLFFPFLGNDFPYGGYGHPPQSLPLPPPVSNTNIMEENSQDSTGTVKSSNAETSSTPFDPIQSSPLNLKSEKSKTREPANMIRVKCDICNKELCNKYFLRTHKLNKHGILDESLGLSSSFKLTDLQKSMLMAENPLYFNGKSSYMDRVKQEPMDGILDAQLKLNAFESQRSMDSNNGNGGSLDSSQYRNQSPVNDNQSDSSDGSRYFRYYTEVCHICQRRFKSLKWLKTHLVVEHNIKEEYIHDMLRENSRMKDSILQTCSLCGMLFPDKVGLQIHMLQEHNAEVTLPDKADEPKSEPKDFMPHDLSSNVNSIRQNLKRKYSKNMKQKLHSCSHCDYKTRWLSNIYTHEERKHNIRSPRKYQFTCTKCPRIFRYEHSLYRHNMECHKMGGNVINHLTNGKASSKFRCGQCKERFATRKLCRLHIRHVHRSESENTAKRFRCSQCEYKTNFATNYRNHLKQKHAKKVLLEPLQNGPCNGEMATDSDEGKKTPVAYATPCDLTSQSSFIMQPFKMIDDTKAGQFVTAVVYLPVYQKISEPVTVSFQLSPTEQ